MFPETNDKGVNPLYQNNRNKNKCSSDKTVKSLNSWSVFVRTSNGDIITKELNFLWDQEDLLVCEVAQA